MIFSITKSLPKRQVCAFPIAACGTPLPAGKPAPTRYLRVRLGRVIIVTGLVGYFTGTDIPGFTRELKCCQYHFCDRNENFLYTV